MQYSPTQFTTCWVLLDQLNQHMTQEEAHVVTGNPKSLLPEQQAAWTGASSCSELIPQIKPIDIAIVGPPGAGKTTLISFLTGPLPPADFYVTSFSRAAIAALREKITDEEPRKCLRTIYSLAHEALFTPSDGSCPLSHYLNLKKGSKDRQKLKLIGLDLKDTRAFNPDTPGASNCPLQLAFDIKRQAPLTPWQAIEQRLTNSRLTATQLRQAFDKYQRFLEREGLLDHAQLLQRVVYEQAVLDAAPIFFLDEAQDLTPLEWQAFDNLSRHAAVRIMVGDPAQSINSWRGADPQAFSERVKTADVSFQLTKTYRNSSVIVDYASKLLTRIPKLPDRAPVAPASEGGHVLRVGTTSWLKTYLEQLPDDEDCFILGRNRRFLVDLADQLSRLHVPFGSCGGLRVGLPEEDESTSYSKASLADALRIASQLAGGRTLSDLHEDELKALQTHLKPSAWAPGSQKTVLTPKALSDLSLGLAAGWFRSLSKSRAQRINLWVRRHGPAVLTRDNIKLMTMHASKGRGADHVVLLNDWSRLSYRSLKTPGGDEHQLAYTAATRARRTLVIMQTQHGLAYPWPARSAGLMAC